MWKWNVCFFRPVWLFCYAPKRCSPCSKQMLIRIHHGNISAFHRRYSPGLQIYNLHILRMSVYPAYQKKEKKKIDHHCFDLGFHQSAAFSIRGAWKHVVLNKALILRVVLLNVLTHSVIGLMSVPTQSQQAILMETISSHLTGSGLLIGLILAKPYTCSLTLNRASLLTMLMFSTGVSVCSCTVLYTVENTWFSPFLSEDMNPRRYMCVSWSCIKDSVRKHTVALTKKKQCCTDQYIWWSLCVYSIHL